jgi:eukaryotic-like serine/threonine-protein kinase
MLMLAGRYRLQQRLAVGGMGSVHVALDERLGRPVAVKLLREELAVEAAFVERFQREAHAAAGLSHPNIAQVYDYGRDGDQHFIVLELVEGTDLAKLLNERGRLAPEGAVRVATQVCAALSAAHTAGIVHRDIKPGNVIVSPSGQVKVTDFGIARALGQTPLTHTGTVMGTAQYLPPEQARGEPAGPASDLYSLGVVLFQMLTGSAPFTGDSPVAVALRHLHESIPAPSDSAPGIPPALDDIVIRATAKDPSQRFVDAGQMADALEQALIASTTAPLPQAASTSPAPVLTSHTSQRRLKLAWVAGALLLLSAIAVAAVLLTGTEDIAPPAASGDAPASKPATRDRQPTPEPTQKRTPNALASNTRPRDRSNPRPDGPALPHIVGLDSKTVEESLKARGYDVTKADIDSHAPKESIVATLPRPGQPLTAGQPIVLLVSKGEPAEQGTSYRVPANLIGANVKDVEDRLKAQDIHVHKMPIDSTTEEDTVLSTYPTPGTQSDSSELLVMVSSGHPPD